MTQAVEFHHGETVRIACRLCGCTDQRVKLVIDRPDRFERAAGIAEAGYRRYWLDCAGCGLLNNHYAHDLSAVYESDYYDPAVEGESVRARFERILAMPNAGSDNWARVQRIKQFVEGYRAAWVGDAPPASVLDIGAGTGIFLYRYLEACPGWSATAVEPVPQACEHLRSLSEVANTDPACTAVRGVQGFYRAGMPELAGERFGLVALNKVVEHLADPVALVRDAGEALAPGGVLYVEVPDKATADHRPATDNILGALHFALFDAATLARVFDRAGLATLQVQRYTEPSGKITVSGFACRAGDFAARCAAGSV